MSGRRRHNIVTWVLRKGSIPRGESRGVKTTAWISGDSKTGSCDNKEMRILERQQRRENLTGWAVAKVCVGKG